MANRIAGITVEIGGDMTKRSKALSSIAAGKRLPLAIRAPSFAASGGTDFGTRLFEYFPSFFCFWAKEKAGSFGSASSPKVDFKGSNHRKVSNGPFGIQQFDICCTAPWVPKNPGIPGLFGLGSKLCR